MKSKLALAGILSGVLVVGLAGASATAGQGGRNGDETHIGANAAESFAGLIREKKESRRLMEPAIDQRIEFLAGQNSATPRSTKQPRSSQITACQDKKTGSLRISNSCTKKEKRLTWNTQGPAGPTGPQGPAGPGATALVYEDFFGPYSIDSQFSSGRNLTCSRGGTATNAGWAVADSEFNFYVLASFQSSDGPNRWYIRVENNNTFTTVQYFLTLYCIL